MDEPQRQVSAAETHGQVSRGSGEPRNRWRKDFLLVVDDHPICQEALVRHLGTLPIVDGVVVAGTAEEGIRLAESLAMRAVLLDVWLPGMSGIEAMPIFRRLQPQCRLIAFSASDHYREVHAAFRAGACAFVSKAAPLERLRDTVTRAVAGRITTPEWVSPDDHPEALADSVSALTRRQRQVIGLLSRGLSNKEMAQQLGLAEITIKQHVSGILRALNVANRTQAVLAARRLGLDL